MNSNFAIKIINCKKHLRLVYKEIYASKSRILPTENGFDKLISRL